MCIYYDIYIHIYMYTVLLVVSQRVQCPAFCTDSPEAPWSGPRFKGWDKPWKPFVTSQDDFWMTCFTCAYHTLQEIIAYVLSTIKNAKWCIFLARTWIQRKLGIVMSDFCYYLGAFWRSMQRWPCKMCDRSLQRWNSDDKITGCGEEQKSTS